MSANIALAAILMGMGVLLSAFAIVVRQGRIDLALGGHTRDNTTADSWRRCHHRIGTWFLAAALGAALAGLAVLLFEDRADPIAAGGFAWLVVVVLAGTVAGVRELRIAGPVDPLA